MDGAGAAAWIRRAPHFRLCGGGEWKNPGGDPDPSGAVWRFPKYDVPQNVAAVPHCSTKLVYTYALSACLPAMTPTVTSPLAPPPAIFIPSSRRHLRYELSSDCKKLLARQRFPLPPARPPRPRGPLGQSVSRCPETSPTLAALLTCLCL